MTTEMHTVIALGLESIPKGWMRITDRTHRNFDQYCTIDRRKAIISDSKGNRLFRVNILNGGPDSAWNWQMRPSETIQEATRVKITY